MKSFFLALVVLLGGCSLVDPNYIAAEGNAIAAAAPGTGAIRSVSVLRLGGYRLYVDMDNGHTQTVDTDSDHFMAGQRVQIAANGHVVAF